MPRSRLKPEPDLLVLGDNPAAYLAAGLLREGASPLRVAHSPLPGEQHVDRLVQINPRLFDLHKLLAPLRKKLDLTGVYGLRFLADDPAVRSEWTSKSIVAFVGTYEQVRAALRAGAQRNGVEFHGEDDRHRKRDPGNAAPDARHAPRASNENGAADVRILGVDDRGPLVQIGKQTIHPRLLLVGGSLQPESRRALGLAGSWEQGILYRYTFLILKGSKWTNSGTRPVITVSLDLAGKLWWGWVLPGPGCVQVCVSQPASEASGAWNHALLLRHWVGVLTRHQSLNASTNSVDFNAARSIDLPLAGALAQDGVANHTLLFGPAGGFYTACAEDIYPNCWSAVFAADAARKALKERHVQDALQSYRQKWGSTLGDFLRGPQQNLRFLLPLVYRNETMTARLAEAILLGEERRAIRIRPVSRVFR